MPLWPPAAKSPVNPAKPVSQPDFTFALEVAHRLPEASGARAAACRETCHLGHFGFGLDELVAQFHELGELGRDLLHLLLFRLVALFGELYLFFNSFDALFEIFYDAFLLFFAEGLALLAGFFGCGQGSGLFGDGDGVAALGGVFDVVGLLRLVLGRCGLPDFESVGELCRFLGEAGFENHERLLAMRQFG